MKDHTGDPALDILLNTMRLPSILQQYRQVAAEAEQGGWDFIRFLKQLVTIEVEDRRVRKLERLLKRSHLPKDKTLSSFDMARMPTKIRRIVPELCKGAFVDKTENVLAFGLPKGVKKQIFSSGPTGCRTDLPLKLAVKYHPACFS